MKFSQKRDPGGAIDTHRDRDKAMVYRGQPAWTRKEPGSQRHSRQRGRSWLEQPLELRGLSHPPQPPTCPYHEQVLALWFQTGHNLLQPLPAPLGEAALIVRQLGDPWPHGFTGCPQGAEDTKELVDLRVTRKQGSADHLKWGRGEGTASHGRHVQQPGRMMPVGMRPPGRWGQAQLPPRIPKPNQIRGRSRDVPSRYLSQGCAKHLGLSGISPASSVL